MPYTRRIPRERVRYSGISAEAVSLFARAVSLERGSPEHSRVAAELHRSLLLRPWHASVLDADPDDASPTGDGLTEQHRAHVRDLRRQLEEAVAEHERLGAETTVILASSPQ
jgi:hypothetical protein